MMNHKKEYYLYALVLIIFGVFTITACALLIANPAREEATPVAALLTPTTVIDMTPTTKATATTTTAVLPSPTVTQAATEEPTTAANTSCVDAATFVADVTVPDGTTFAPYTGFIKTWRLKNSGSCTWDNQYQLIHAGGHQLGAITDQYPLPAMVLPGQMIDVSVSLVAPADPAAYRGDWKLQNAKGHPFGIGKNHDRSVWVDIVVATPQPENNGKISGFAWQDQDFDNQVEANEFLADVAITLSAGANCGTELETTPTDENGRFAFENLAAGDYCLTGSDGSVTVGQAGLILVENGQLTDVNVTWPPVWPEPAAISGWVWHDYCAVDVVDDNPVPQGHCVDDGSGGYVADGMIQPEETYIVGVTVKLVSDSCVGDTLAAQLTAVTNSAGRYRFDNLQPGLYCLFIDAAELSNTGSLGSGNWTFPGYGVSYHEISIQAGDEATPVNFGWDFDKVEN